MDVIETKLVENSKELKEAKKIIVEMRDEMKKMAVNSNFVEKEYVVDVRYVDESEGLRMKVDSGAPMLILSAGWLEIYLREMKVDNRDVEKRSCNRRFRFGEKV